LLFGIRGEAMSFIRYRPFGLWRMKVLIRGNAEYHRRALVVKQPVKQSATAKLADVTLTQVLTQTCEAKLADVTLTQTLDQSAEAELA